MNGPANICTEKRRAYTLIEMIIALVLVSALMSSVWGIMSLYNSLLTAGRKQTTQQQLVRSVFQLIDEDLNAVVASSQPVPPSEVDDFSVTPDFNIVEIADSFGNDTTSRLPPVQMSLTGTATAIRLSGQRFVVPVHKAPSDMDLLNELGGGRQFSKAQLPAGEAAHVPEFQTIVYQLQAPGAADSLNALSSGLYRLQANSSEFQSLVAQQSTVEQNMATDDVAVGRATLEALLFPAADSLAAETEGTDSGMPAVSFERIPEIVGCRFQYFNGQTWQDSWSADQSSQLPAAVRVSIDVVSSAAAQQWNSLNSSRPEADLLAGQTGAATNVAQAIAPDASTDAAASVVRATRFERTILLDTVRSPASATAGGVEDSL